MSANPIAPSDDRRPLYTISPQPTFVDGVRYDSKLEARRVVWLEHLGIRFSYHPSVQRVSYGKLYTPDFFLPDFGVFVEIKPYLDVAFLERSRPLALYGAVLLTIFGSPGDPEECATLQVRGARFDGGRLLQCAAMKTVNHQAVFCGGLVLAAERGTVSFVVPVGHHNHAKYHYFDSDEAQDRDVSTANRAAATARFDASDDEPIRF